MSSSNVAMNATSGQHLDSKHPSEEEVMEQLQRLLDSDLFRNTKRHQRILQYLCNKYVLGEASELKERIIGIQVFEREPTYDAGADPIVRGAITDLRKRLALYYSIESHAEELRLEIPVGSYVPQFHRPERVNYIETVATVTEPLTTVSSRPVEEVENRLDVQKLSKSRKLYYLVAAVTLIICGLIWTAITVYRTAGRPDRDLEAFWKPILANGTSPLVCAGTLNGIMRSQQAEDDTWRHVTATMNHLDPNIGMSLMYLGEYMGRHDTHLSLKLADATNLAELRRQPGIFIGGLNNPWTERVQSHMRFQMRSIRPGVSAVVDSKQDNRVLGSFDFDASVHSITKSYAIVTRENDPLTGQNIVSLAGLGSYGNSSATEFVVTPSYFSQFAASAPKGWERRNIQIVLETEVVDGRSSPPKVIASELY
jgi:hypothetical protein